MPSEMSSKYWTVSSGNVLLYGGGVELMPSAPDGERVRRELDRLARRVGGAADDDGHPAGGGLDRGLGDPAALLGRLREPLAGRAVDEQAVHAAADVALEQRAQRVEVEALLGVERGGAGGPVALPGDVVAIHASLLRRRRGGSTRSARERGRQRARIGRGQLLGEQPRHQRAEREAGRGDQHVVAGQPGRLADDRREVVGERHHAGPGAHDPARRRGRHHAHGDGGVAGRRSHSVE